MTDTISHPTRIRIISSANNNNSNNSSINSNNNSNSLKRKQPTYQQQQQQANEAANQTLPGTSKKLTLRLRPPPPPPPPQQPSSSSSSSPLPPNAIPPTGPTLDQINQIRSLGLQLWHRIVNSTDADGRLRSIDFMDLPSAVDYPDYYQFIKHPIALNLIKSKLDSEHDPYLSLDTLLSDLKLVFSNAKKYNVEYSGIYKDAQALLKIVRKDPFTTTRGGDLKNQAELPEPKQKKLKLKLRPSQPTQPIPTPSTTPANGIKPTPPATFVIPPTPVDPVSQNGTLAQTQSQPATAPAPVETRAQTTDSQAQPQASPSQPQASASAQLPSMSSQEIERIQSEVRAQTEARNRAQAEAQLRELRAREESRKQEEARQHQLRLQAQTRQLELRQQAEAQKAQPLRTQAPPPTRPESHAPAPSQTESPLLAQVPVQAHARSPARVQAQLQLQSPSRVETPTINQSRLPERSTPTTRASHARASPQVARPTTPTPSQSRLSPSPSKPKINLNKLKLWIRTVIENLEGLTDRAGRQLIEEFQTLPDKARWKSYYQIIPDPIAFENISTRNNRTGYKDFESFKDDVLRIFKNAQHFNEDGSMVWNDSKVLEAKFIELIHRPPLELADIVLPHLSELNAKKVNGGQATTPTSSINGKRKSPGKETPLKQVELLSTLAAPAVPKEGLRRSSRSPSRPPSALGSPPVTRSSRAVSPLPRRAPSPKGPPKKPTPIPPHSIANPPPTRPPSRLANDISPALISIANSQIGSRNVDPLVNQLGPTTKVRSMNVIPIKSADGYPPMINRFRITSRPKTMETLKIKNKRVFQHGFRVPRTTETIVIESELNRAWPMTRQLRSSIGLIKVKVEQVRVRGVPERLPLSHPPVHHNSTPAHQPEKDNGVLATEVKLVDGLNLVELAIVGRPDAHKNDLAAASVNLLAGIDGPAIIPSSNSSLPGTPLSSTSSSSSGGLVRESYRLFIYR
ncbi:hypothetical protein PGT21_027201 [Puccinia graminis f. sp. tritici]|uniref:Bromo domain-containing protein n=1 Tax=Puccinia graminis f. sp. tritici TaxID=56615 RepID=A0A5B0NEV3_PUCGR|nr:hypothetical protein PGT21_027201 [Puccinia graminis f. sp. tritici]